MRARSKQERAQKSSILEKLIRKASSQKLIRGSNRKEPDRGEHKRARGIEAKNDVLSRNVERRQTSSRNTEKGCSEKGMSECREASRCSMLVRVGVIAQCRGEQRGPCSEQCLWRCVVRVPAARYLSSAESSRLVSAGCVSGASDVCMRAELGK